MNTKSNSLRTRVAVELARRGMRQRDLAQLLNVPPTTLSTWITGAHPAPADLAERIAKALDLTPTCSRGER